MTAPDQPTAGGMTPRDARDLVLAAIHEPSKQPELAKDCVFHGPRLLSVPYGTAVFHARAPTGGKKPPCGSVPWEWAWAYDRLTATAMGRPCKRCWR